MGTGGDRRGQEGTVPSTPYLVGKHPVTPYFTPQSHVPSRKIKDLRGEAKLDNSEKKTQEDVIRAVICF